MGADALRPYTGTPGLFSGTGGSSVPVGVMDTGLNINHPDIAEHRQSICGVNFVSTLDREAEDLWLDAGEHGTHVTGTITSAVPDLPACRFRRQVRRERLGGEQAGAVEIEERRQGGLGEGRPDGRADLGREALRDVVVAEPAADHVGVLAFSEGIVVGVPRPGLGEALDAQLVEQRGDAVVDVLAAGASLRDALSA